MAERPHRKLMKCHVLFLGDSTPEQTNHGLQSLQEPLMKCYPVDSPSQVEGIDSWLTLFTSGILLQYVGNRNETTTPIWFPIQNLHLAASTKCINYIDSNTGQRMETEFVDINNPVAKNSSHPPLFSIIVRKASGKRVLRCYTFLVRDAYPAEMLVDSAKHAFVNKSGWSNSTPPQEVVEAELVHGTDDADDVDQFDSVSAAGRKSGGNQSPSDTDASADQNKSFPAHLVKKYTLKNTNRGTRQEGGSSPRRPIPREFMQHGGSTVRSIHHGIGVGHPSIPPQMMNGGYRLPPEMGSIRTTSSVRIVKDPRTRAPVIERLIREEVPVPVPVYQPPPPPQIIEHVKPVYIPQPPEIRHVDREVPVAVPVPYAVQQPPYYDSSSSRHSRRSKSHKHHTFKNYQVFDDRFIRKDYDRSSSAYPGIPYNFSAPPQGFAIPSNGFYAPPGELYHHVKDTRNQRSRGRRHSSSDDSSDEEYDRRRVTRAYNPNIKRGGIEITELHSPDERSKPDVRSDRREQERRSKNYHIRELEKETQGLNIKEVNNNGLAGSEFKWSAIPSSSPAKEKEDRRRKSKNSFREDSYSPERTTGQVYVGADPVESSKDKRASYHMFGSAGDPLIRSVGDPLIRSVGDPLIRSVGDPLIEELKQRGKGKKKRDKKVNEVEEYPDYNGASTSKEYYFKDQTENPPRNWMDQKKGYMNERAFSSSLFNDPDSNITNAYALNRESGDETMFDRSMPGPTPGIPMPPPMPADMQAAAGMY